MTKDEFERMKITIGAPRVLLHDDNGNAGWFTVEEAMAIKHKELSAVSDEIARRAAAKFFAFAQVKTLEADSPIIREA